MLCKMEETMAKKTVKRKSPAEKSKRTADKLKAPVTRGKNQAGQTNGQFEMTLKERGKGQTTSAGGAPRQIY
jgi:hypothetical protein